MRLKAIVIAIITLALLTTYATSAFAIEENKDNPTDTGTPDVSPSPGQTNDKNNPEKQITTEPEVKTKTEVNLPKCDGTFKDCVTKNGDTCKAGEKSHACECSDDMSDCPNHPSMLSKPDKSCAFNPDSPKCHPDKDGNCPPGFSHNVHGNCFPSGKCPSGFSRHTDDETGKCFRDHNDHRTIVIEKHTSSSSSSHNLSDKCFGEIKTAWLAKIHRGQNSKVDSIIDNCLNVK